MDNEPLALEILDPSPIDPGPSSPTPLKSSSTSTTLGLQNNTLIFHLGRIHRYSTYPLTAFLAAHITNTTIIPLATRSIPASDTYLLLTRPYYQSPFAEPLLIFLPLASHLASGALLRLIRRRTLKKHYGHDPAPWPTISGTSLLGFCLAPILASHVLVNRLVPLWVDGGSSGVGFAFVAHGFGKHPVFANIVYTSLVGVGVAHFVWGWAKWLGWTSGRSGSAASRRRSKWTVNTVVGLVTGLWMAGGLGIIGRGGKAGGWVGRGFDGLYKSVPLVGRIL